MHKCVYCFLFYVRACCLNPPFSCQKKNNKRCQLSYGSTSACVYMSTYLSPAGIVSKRLNWSSWCFVENLSISKIRVFCHNTSITATCCQLCSTKVNARCEKLANVVCRTKLTILAKVDVRLTSWAILSHLASISVYSRMRVGQRVARVHLRLLILVSYCSAPLAVAATTVHAVVLSSHAPSHRSATYSVSEIYMVKWRHRVHGHDDRHFVGIRRYNALS